MSAPIVLPQLATGDQVRPPGVFALGAAAPPDVGWVASATITGGLNYISLASAVAPDGSVYYAGSATVAGNSVGHLAKFNSAGTLQWQLARGIGSAFGVGFADVKCDAAGNVYVTGWIANGIVPATLVAKFDSTGALLWQRRLTGASDTYEQQRTGGSIYTFLNGLDVSSAGDVYVATSSRATGPLAGFAPSAILAKWNTAGVLQWQRWVSGPSGSQAWGAALDEANGLVYLLGQPFIQAFSTAGVAGALINRNNFNGESFVSGRCDSAGNLYTCGLTRESALDTAWWACKFDATLTLQWQRQLYLTGSDCDTARLAVNAAGSRVAVAGIRPVPAAPLAAGWCVYDGSGVLQWQRRASDSGGLDSTDARGVALNATNQLAVAVSTPTPGTGAQWLAPSNGSVVPGTYASWLYTAADPLTEAAAAVASQVPAETTGAATLGESAASTANVAVAYAWGLVTIP